MIDYGLAFLSAVGRHVSMHEVAQGNKLMKETAIGSFKAWLSVAYIFALWSQSRRLNVKTVNTPQYPQLK